MKKTYLLFLASMLVVACEGDTIYHIFPGANPDGGTGEMDATVADAKPDAKEEGGLPGVPIKIGSVAFPNFDNAMQQTATLVEQQVNAAGGLLDGRPLEVVFRAEATDPAAVVEDFRTLTGTEEVVGIVGGWNIMDFAVHEILKTTKTVNFTALSGFTPWGDPQGEEVWSWAVRHIPFEELCPAYAAVKAQGCASVGSVVTAPPPLVDTVKGIVDGITGGMGIENKATVVVVPGVAPNPLDYDVFTADPPECLLVNEAAFGATLLNYADVTGDTDVTYFLTIYEPQLKYRADEAGVTDLSPVNGGYISDVSGVSLEAWSAFTTMYDANFSNPILPGFEVQVGFYYDGLAIEALAVEMAGSTDGDAIRAAMTAVMSADEGDVVIGPGEIAKGLQAIRDGKGVDYNGVYGDYEFGGGAIQPPLTNRVWQVKDMTMIVDPEAGTNALELVSNEFPAACAM